MDLGGNSGSPRMSWVHRSGDPTCGGDDEVGEPMSGIPPEILLSKL